MRRPHVFERSAPRSGHKGAHEPADPATTARVIASQLGHMIERAEGAALPTLAVLLDAARIEAETGAGSEVADGRNEPPHAAAVCDVPDGIPLMITRRQRERLRELGWSEEQIREMAPEQAHRLLNS